MNTQKATNEHLLLIRGTHWNQALSPAELQTIMADFYRWVDNLAERGILAGAQPLMEEGIVVAGKSATVTDGVYAESKEAIAGYFLLQVKSTEDAVAIAQKCPIVAHGARIEVRPVADQCRPMAEVAAAFPAEALTH